jgi:glutamate carboxypeptidase
MNYSDVLDYFSQKQDEILQTIRLLVEQETPSDDKERLDAFARLLAERYQAAGAAVEIIANETRGDHVRATFADPAYVTDLNAKPALILCHFDTVWPVGSLATHPFRVDEQGWAYGPGIFDMQSSLALAEYVLRGVQELGLKLPRPLVLLATSDEEVGSYTSRQLIEEEALRSAYVLVMESPLPGGVIKTARKGSGGFTLKVHGRAAHAGVDPEKGISAIQEMAHQILRIHGLSNLDKGTTLNVGVVTGGTRPNVVAAYAEALVDVRAWTQSEMDRVRQAITNLKVVMDGAEIEVEGGENRPALERSATGELFRQAQIIGAKLGLDLKEGRTGGGSDGNLTGALGIPTLDGLGVPGEGAHADDEHIEVDQIGGRAALLTALLMELSGR